MCFPLKGGEKVHPIDVTMYVDKYTDFGVYVVIDFCNTNAFSSLQCSLNCMWKVLYIKQLINITVKGMKQ